MKAIVIGAGFSGLSAASVLAKEGIEVQVIDRLDQPGGRCRTWEHDGFTFDMGPSWYWMPDVFESFFQRFDHSTKDYYELIRLDPSYQVFFKNQEAEIPADFEEFKALLESWEPGAAQKAEQFFEDAKYKYEVGMRDLVYKPSFSLFEFADSRIASSIFRLKLFTSIQSEVYQLFKDDRIRKLFEFPVLFLGAKPSETPALYSLMNYADTCLGTWYPKGGMKQVSFAFEQVALEQGVQIHYNEEVIGFECSQKKITSIQTDKQTISDVDLVISGADYHHIEQLLPSQFQSYTSNYWASRKMAPSALLYFVGLNKKLQSFQHHNLFFDTDFEEHSRTIYDDASWPEQPLFYMCVPSKTDQLVAPANQENLFILIPIAPDLQNTPEIEEHYFNMVLSRLEQRGQEQIKNHVLFKRAFSVSNFKETYHAFKGNAYGLANTLKQTAILKPKMRSKKLKNLFYCGQLTVPGPGVPPSIISGQVIADYIRKQIWTK